MAATVMEASKAITRAQLETWQRIYEARNAAWSVLESIQWSLDAGSKAHQAAVVRFKEADETLRESTAQFSWTL